MPPLTTTILFSSRGFLLGVFKILKFRLERRFHYLAEKLRDSLLIDDQLFVEFRSVVGKETPLGQNPNYYL